MREKGVRGDYPTMVLVEAIGQMIPSNNLTFEGNNICKLFHWVDLRKSICEWLLVQKGKIQLAPLSYKNCWLLVLPTVIRDKNCVAAGQSWNEHRIKMVRKKATIQSIQWLIAVGSKNGENIGNDVGINVVANVGAEVVTDVRWSAGSKDGNTVLIAEGFSVVGLGDGIGVSRVADFGVGRTRHWRTD